MFSSNRKKKKRKIMGLTRLDYGNMVRVPMSKVPRIFPVRVNILRDVSFFDFGHRNVVDILSKS